MLSCCDAHEQEGTMISHRNREVPVTPRTAHRDVPTPTSRRPTKGEDVFLHYPGSAIVVALLADKWTIPVIHALGRGTKRTGELKKMLPGVSQKMLTQTLRRLEEHGLLERTLYAEVPPRVEYALTAMGTSINEPLTAMCEWVAQHGAALAESHTRR
jgi:DNA-binding HxlR family transcriptional regulator